MPEPTFRTGELIAVKMRNRRYGLIWVVGAAKRGELCRVVGLEWFGREPPSEEVAAEAQLLHLSHRWYDDLPFAARLIESSKPTMVAVGSCEVLPEWLDFDFVSQQTDWKAIAATLYREYRWREDAKYRASIADLPQVGDTYAFELREDVGGWGAGRVIRATGSIGADRYSVRRIVFGVPARWEKKPSLAEVESAIAARSEHPRFGEIGTTDALPKSFVPLGNLPPTPEELALVDGKGWGMWEFVRGSVAHHWRLENDEAYAIDLRNRRYGATFAVPLSGGGFDLFAHFRTDNGRALGLHVPARLSSIPKEARLPKLLAGVAPHWVRVEAPRPDALVYLGNAGDALNRIERTGDAVRLAGWEPLMNADRYASIDDWPLAGTPPVPPPPTLDELAARTFFESWKGHVDAKDLKKSRQILKALHRSLAKGDDAEAVIQTAVEAFNAIDDFIMTIEREDIFDALWLYGRAAGIADPEALIDEHRDW